MRFHVKDNILLFDFLLKALHGISRTAVKQMLARRQVFVDGLPGARFDCPLEPGMTVEINKRGGETCLPGNLIKIIYEDAYILVANKKEGLLSVATESRTGEITAHSLLNSYIQDNPGYVKKNRFAQQARIFIVHRLDRETSGLMVFAKDMHTKTVLQQQWNDLVTDRRYVALAEGEIVPNNGTITSWLTDNKAFITYSSKTDNGGKKAVTRYTVLKKTPRASLVELELETGRKNQIRVHMQDIGHPILGDTKYGGIPEKRLYLHAFKLSFRHPVTGEQMNFTSETPFTL